MPQAKVYGIRERLVPIRDALSEAINESISDAFKFPRERRLQRFFPMDREDFIYPPTVRSDRYTIIEFSTFDYKNDPQAQKAFIKGYDDWKVRLNPLYWFESGVERGWLRAGKGHEAVVRYWAGCKP